MDPYYDLFLITKIFYELVIPKDKRSKAIDFPSNVMNSLYMTEGDDMLYFLIVTDHCDLHCSYCGAGKPLVHQEEMGFSIENLKQFMMKDPDPKIIFYGGLRSSSSPSHFRSLLPSSSFLT